MAKSDGIWRWYWGLGTECEAYHLAASRDDAYELGMGECAPGDVFTIVEATKLVPSFKVFDADRVFEEFEEHNEECWGEDGAEIAATEEQKRDLEERLASVLRAWAPRDFFRAWSLGEFRNEEEITVPGGAEA